MVAILLVKDFDKWAEAEKAKENAPKEEAKDVKIEEKSCESPLLDTDVTTIGISNKGHAKCTNSIQFLFIHSTVNKMV